MKKLILFLILFVSFSCTTTKNTIRKDSVIQYSDYIGAPQILIRTHGDEGYRPAYNSISNYWYVLKINQSTHVLDTIKVSTEEECINNCIKLNTDEKITVFGIVLACAIVTTFILLVIQKKEED